MRAEALEKEARLFQTLKVALEKGREVSRSCLA
jgi:hypothetical protein